VFRETRKLFVDDLDIEPGADLCELHQAILAGSVAVAPVAVVAPPPPPTRPIPAQLPIATSLFSGRADELAEMDNLLAAGATVPVVIVTGTSGVGKTALSCTGRTTPGTGSRRSAARRPARLRRRRAGTPGGGPGTVSARPRSAQRPGAVGT
jgi:hypothetical protein